MKLGWTEGGIQVGWLHDAIRRESQGSEQTEMPKRMVLGMVTGPTSRSGKWGT